MVCPHVLIDQDQKIAQKIAMITMMELNCITDTADTGAQALKLFNKTRYDLILMDLGLPDMDGLTVTEMIRRMEDENTHTPIIALTANADESYKRLAFDVGMDEFVLKPLTDAVGKQLLKTFLPADKFVTLENLVKSD